VLLKTGANGASDRFAVKAESDAVSGPCFRFSVLGPLEVCRDGVVVRLGGVRSRAVLAVLSLNANRVVSTDRLVDELWGERPPKTARTALQGHVAQVRRALGEGSEAVLVTESGGYRLRITPGGLDLERFEQLVSEARLNAADGDFAVASERLGEALALWRGPALADVSSEAFAGLEAGRLEEARLMALEERIEADLALGRHRDVVGESRALVREYPLRERLWGQLMLALYRSGRQAEALDAYREARQVLVDELGLEPGPGLCDLEQAILAHDPGLLVDMQREQQPESPLARPTALASLTPLVGREDELGELDALIRDPGVRLVTLTGSGGIGKTRVLLAGLERSAEAFTGGAILVLLAGLSDPELVASEIARAVGASGHGSESVVDTLGRFLAERELLVGLDNFEQIVDAAPVLVGLLARAPGLKLLVTSRTRLRVSGEHVFVVPPLELPDPEHIDDIDAISKCETVRLFVARARAASHDFALSDETVAEVAKICARLEGVPLALELAAARTRLLTPTALLKHLDERLAVLTGGPRDAPTRHQTLRATLDWSYQLLDEPTRELFARLAVFVGGFTIEAAQAVCLGDPRSDAELLDRLAQLTDHSLLDHRAGTDGEPRFAMLETVREYADERLGHTGDEYTVHRGHAEHFLSFAREADSGLKGPEQDSWLARLEAEHDNLRAALTWSLATDCGELAMTLAGELRRFWRYGLHLREAERWLEQALAAGPPTASVGRVNALLGMSIVLYDQAHHERAVVFADQALALARELGDAPFIACCCNSYGIVAQAAGDVELGAVMYAEYATVARRTSDWHGLMTATGNLANLVAVEGDYEQAISLADEALELGERVGDRHHMSLTHCTLAVCSLRAHRPEKAIGHVAQAVRLSRTAKDPWTVVLCLQLAAATFAQTGQIERAARLFARAENLRKPMGRALESPERELIGQALSGVQARLHEPAVAAAWAQGETISLDDALADLLGN
jgi:predicted ATPase/DNA-binding SARP family transcriptional activator